MIIYIIIKIILSFWLIFKLKGVKEMGKISLSIDIIIMICFISLLGKQEINIITEIFILSIIIVSIFLLYKLLNYIMKNNLLILEKIKKKIGEKKQEKIKRFFLKPVISKVIYYMIGMLPGNILYGIYFGIAENGGYIRVGINSTRDIILGKIFKWDSRKFFYNLFEKYNKNKIIKKIKKIRDKIIKMILRIQFIIFFIRENIIIMKTSKYIGVRIIIYMYLTIFYYYLFEELHIINKYLFYILIISELIIIYKMEKIIEYFEKDILKIGEEVLKKNEYKIYVTYLYTFKNPLYGKAIYKGQGSVSFWDLTLSNSVSLNILYKYILFVNKNTKGYFDKQMNIGTRLDIIKIMTIDDIYGLLGSILPRTRYVIISLKYKSYETTYDIICVEESKIAKNKVNLSQNKNLYLSYYEKTYSKTSLLMLVGMMRTNLIYGDYFGIDIRKLHSEIIKDESIANFYTKKHKNTIMMVIIIYLYIMRHDKRLIKNVNMLLEFFFNCQYEYFLEEKYFELYEKDLIEKGIMLPISNKICGIKNYKKIFKIMSRIMGMEEETVNGNLQLIEMLKKFKFSIIQIFELENINSEKEQEFFNIYDSMFMKLIGLFVTSMDPRINYFKEREIFIISQFCKLKNKKENGIYDNFEKIGDNGGKLEETLEMDDNETVLEYIQIGMSLNKNNDQLIFLFIYVLNYQMFFQNCFNSNIESSLIVLNTEERIYTEYKDFLYFLKNL